LTSGKGNDNFNGTKAVDRLDFLRLLQYISEVRPNRAILIEEHGLLDIVDAGSREIDCARAHPCFETRTRFDCFVRNYRRGIGGDKGRAQ
jgi:hypothetical protein